MKQRKKLSVTRKWLEAIDENVIQNNNDRVVAVVGDEGSGKSTLMLQMAILWERIRHGDVVDDRVLENILWGGRDEFVNAMRERDEGSMIAVQDAAHVLFSKEAMHGSQIEIEKSLLDIRIRNMLIVLGFQDFDDMPAGLKSRRVENVFYLESHKGQPTGNVKIYNRDSIDHREREGEWPDEPDQTDRFEDLDGTEIWERFEEQDTQAKLDRLGAVQDDSPEDIMKREQMKIGIRAVRPWDDEHGMTQTDAADYLLDFSQTWLSKRIKAWERGEYDDLLEEDEIKEVTRGEFGDISSR